jgi:hypothetical protein
VSLIIGYKPDISKEEIKKLLLRHRKQNKYVDGYEVLKEIGLMDNKDLSEDNVRRLSEDDEVEPKNEESKQEDKRDDIKNEKEEYNLSKENSQQKKQKEQGQQEEQEQEYKLTEEEKQRIIEDLKRKDGLQIQVIDLTR